ncbi:glycosyltransferase [candidate division KSB1 bacterium]|nr:glycosyltransferase [candidate division KSB1 bacterium]
MMTLLYKFLFFSSLFFIVYSYILYPILLKVISLFYTRQRIKADLTPTISMLVAAYNEQDVILDKIQNTLELDYPKENFELVIGSDGSDDATNDIVQMQDYPWLKFIPFENRRGKAAMLNSLVQNARGEILVFSDANTMYEPSAIKNLVQHFADPKVGGVCGRLYLNNPNHNPGGKGESLYWNYENILKSLESKIKSVLGANGAIYAMRKFLYKPLPEKILIVDDFLTPIRVIEQDYEMVFDSDARAHETTSPSLMGEFRRKSRIGASNFTTLIELRHLLNPGKGFIALAFWSHKILRWLVPFFMILIFISSFFLSFSLPLFSYLFFFQVIFYLAALAGYVLDSKMKCPRALVYPYYFTAVNLALLVGFIRFLSRKQKPAWSRVERS